MDSDCYCLHTSAESYNSVTLVCRVFSSLPKNFIRAKRAELTVMAISVIPSVIVLIGTGWKPVGGQLLASAVLLLSGYQDLPRKGARFRVLIALGADFWFFMALASGISALATAIWVKLWVGVAICTVVLRLETWLINQWQHRRTSA